MLFFLRFMTWFSIRHFRAHPWRVLAVLFGIGLGAAVFTSVRLAMDASLDSFTRSTRLIAGESQWSVVTPGGRVDERLLAPLLSHPAVFAAAPLITTYVSTPGVHGEPFLLIGVEPVLDRELHSWRIDSAEREVVGIWLDLISRPCTMLPAKALADRRGWSPGDSITLEHAHQVSRFQVIGVLGQEGLSLVEGGRVAVADIASVQEFMGIQGRVDRIDLRLRPGSGEAEIAGIRALLPPGTLLEESSEDLEAGRRMIRAYEMNLSLLSFVSLFVGMFLVYSLVSLNVAARRRELSILSSLGVSANKIFAATLSEGVILGVCGWVLALPIGAFLVKSMVQGISGTINHLFVRVRVETLRFDPWEILLSFGVTLLVSLVAAFRPALEATRISPREAMTMQETPAVVPGVSRARWVQGGAMIAIALPLARVPGLPGFPVTGYFAILLLVLGFSILSLPVLHWVGSVLPRPLRKIGGEPAFLAARYVRDAGPRISISVGALVTAVSLFVALVVMIHSFRQTVTLWVHQTLSGDAFVRPKMAGLNRYRDPLPEEAVRALKQLDGVEIVPYRHLELKLGGVAYELEAVPFDGLLRHNRFLLLSGRMEEIRGKLVSGEGVVVSEVFSNQMGISAGDRVRLALGGQELDAEVLGVFRDYRTRGGIVYIDLRRYRELTGDRLWSGVRLFFRERGQDSAETYDRVRGELLRQVGQEHPLEIASGTELRQEILEIFDETFAVTIVLLLIALVVAGLGIATTLTVLVLGRIRQLNTLMAVGGGGGQIRAMIFWESLLVVATGEGMGILCGFLMSYLLIYVVNLQSFGWTFLYRVDWGPLLAGVPLILSAALLAAIPAVRLVLKSSPAEALKDA